MFEAKLERNVICMNEQVFMFYTSSNNKLLFVTRRSVQDINIFSCDI